MTAPNLRTKALIIAALFATVVIFMSVYVSFSINKSKENIIQVNTEISVNALERFGDDIQELIEKVWIEELKGKAAITRQHERLADSILSESVYAILKEYEGIEGGIYFFELDEFIGYAYPSIPSPKPVFGPPPRSYNIIRDQVRASILESRRITELHGFDPATFPLSTQPVNIDGENIAGLWTRVHIARELAATGNVTRALVNMTLIVTLLGFIIAITVSWRLKKSMEDIRLGLEKVKTDNEYRLPEKKGLPGFINHHINDMLSNLLLEQKKRHKLEKELNQKEKMATLGKMIAGAAHEINTPISIIKTRVQMWERMLAKSNGVSTNSPVSKESMELVRHEIDRVSKLVKRLLVFSRPVSELKQVFNLLDVIRERAEATYKNGDSSQVVINIISDEKKFAILGDMYAIEQVIINVLNNSVQSGATKVDFTLRKSESGSFALLKIEDNGSGISDEVVGQVFDPFFTTKEDGTGLGLSIAYEIIRAHNGGIHYEKSPGGGTICFIELPLNKEETVPAHA